MAQVPSSIFVLLGSLKKLICVDVPLNKSIIWQLTRKTIHDDEFKSNFVYTVLQQLFDVVDVSCEEVYKLLKKEDLAISPKLLMNVRKERKFNKLKATQVSISIYCGSYLNSFSCCDRLHRKCTIRETSIN